MCDMTSLFIGIECFDHTLTPVYSLYIQYCHGSSCLKQELSWKDILYIKIRFAHDMFKYVNGNLYCFVCLCRRNFMQAQLSMLRSLICQDVLQNGRRRYNLGLKKRFEIFYHNQLMGKKNPPTF